MGTSNFEKQSIDDMLSNFDENFDYTGLPSSIIITNVPHIVFADQNVKQEFESLFQKGDNVLSVVYLPSFKRVRVEFDSPKSATYYRIILHEKMFEGSFLRAYFIEIPLQKSTDPYLKLPPPFKNFLISPPTSPPEGWEQVTEAQPVINMDLLSALAQLTPGEIHEIHPETHKTPKIVVHIAEEEEDDEGSYDEELDLSDEALTLNTDERMDIEAKNSETGNVAGTDGGSKKGKRRRKKKATFGEKDYDLTKASSIHTPRPPLKT